MPIGSGIVYNTGDLILSQVSSSGTAFLETKIAAATSSLIYFDSTARINSASLNSITVGTASYVSGSTSIITNITASNISASATGSFGIVGIGTTSPVSKLHIVDTEATITLQGNQLSGTRYNRLRFANQPGTINEEIYAGYYGVGGLYISDYSNVGLFFGVSNTPGTFTERVRIANDGNVGIGTTNPTTKLHVSGSVTALDGAFVSNVTSGTDRYFLNCYGTSTNQIFALYENSNTAYLNSYSSMAFRANQNGGSGGYFVFTGANVGIGTTIPTNELHIYKLTGPTLNLQAGGTGTDGFKIIKGDSGEAYVYNQGAYGLSIGTNNTQRIYITSTGNVGIGTTSPNAKFDVRPDSSWVGSEAVIIDTDGGNNPRIKLYRPDGASTTSSYAIHLRNDSGNLNILNTGVNSTLGSETVTSKFYITTVGNVGIGTTVPGAKLQVAGNISGSSFTSSISNAVGFLGTSSWAQNVVSASFATTAQTANALNTANSYTITNLTASNISASLTGSFGMVGIGTTSPVGKLTVQGNIEVNYNSITADSSVRRSFLTAHATINRGANIAFGLLDGGSVPGGMTVYNTAAAAGAYNSQFIGFNTHEGGVNEGERMRITSLGNVGIGTTSPSYLLDVYKTSNDSVIRSRTIGAGAYLYLDSATDGWYGINLLSGSTSRWFMGGYGTTSFTITRGIGATEYFRIDTAGNVGIGTSTVSTKLAVEGGSVSTVNVTGSDVKYSFDIRTLVGGAIGFNNAAASNVYGAVTGSAYFGVAQSYPIVFTTAGAERMRLDSTGGINIGTPSQLNSSRVSIADSAVKTSAGNCLTFATATGGSNDFQLIISRGSNTSGYYAFQAVEQGIGYKNIVFNQDGGNVGVGTTNPVAKLQVAGNISGSSFTSSISNAVGFLGTSSWANNVVSASYALTSSFATRAQTANALNASNTYSIAGLTSAYVDVDGSSAPTTGIYRPSTKTLGLSADGTLIFKISNVSSPATSSIETGNFVVQSGNVGLGTNSPNNKLDIFGATGTTLNMSNVDDGSRGGKLTFISSSATGRQFYVGTNSSIYNLVFGIDSIEKMRLDTSGNLGIGTTNPAYKLDVSGSVFVSGVGTKFSGPTSEDGFRLKFYDNGGITNDTGIGLDGAGLGSEILWFNALNGFYWYVGTGGEKMRLTSAGNLGIGTSSPAQKLEVQSGSVLIRGDGNALFGTYYASAGENTFFTLHSGSGNTFHIGNDVAGTNYNTMVFTAATDSTGGKVGIGTSSPGSKLQINDNTPVLTIRANDGGVSRKAYIDFYTTFFNFPSDVGARRTSTIVTGFDSGTWGTEFLAFNVGSGSANDAALLPIERARIDGSGNLGIGTTVPTARLHVSGSTGGVFEVDTAGGATTFYVSASGNVGIGTANATDKLTLYGALASYKTGADTIQTQVYLANTGNTRAFNLQLNSGGTGLDLWSYNSANAWLRHTTFDYDGRVGIGTAASILGKLQLDSGVAPYYGPATGSATPNGMFTLGSVTGDVVNTFGVDASATAYAWIQPRKITVASYSNLVLNPNGGNVGIGTVTPAAKLEITGSSNSALLNIKSPISGAILYVSGSGAVGIGTSNVGAFTLQVSGSFGATTKSFIIDHPTKAGKKLMYGSLESPYHGIRLTGRDTLVNGKCKVELPDYIYKLILHDSVNIQLTGIKCNKTLYVDDINIPENYFTIAYDKAIFESYKDYDFFWDFTAIRADVPELTTEL